MRPLRALALLVLAGCAAATTAEPTTPSTVSPDGNASAAAPTSQSTPATDALWVGHVAPPSGVLGPVTAVAVDPESVGVGWNGSTYTIPAGFTWDESVDGGYLLFNRGRAVVTGNGVSISGALFDSIIADRNPVMSAGRGVGAFTLSHFRVVGGRGSAAVGGSMGRGNGSVISNFEILRFDGDGIKPMISSTITDGYINVVYRPGSAKHYDGVQITGRSGVTLARLRFRIEGNDKLNSAIFIQNDPNSAAKSDNTTITDIDVEYAPYVWYPIRIQGGTANARNIVGRGPKSADGKRPAALVLYSGQTGIDWTTIWTAFDQPVDKSAT